MLPKKIFVPHQSLDPTGKQVLYSDQVLKTTAEIRVSAVLSNPVVEFKISSEAESSVFGVLLLIVASLLFSFYTSNFADYNASYGSIGAMVILMLWFPQNLYLWQASERSFSAFVLAATASLIPKNSRIVFLNQQCLMPGMI